jgi:hypothetical protein
MPDQTRRDFYNRRLAAMQIERETFISHYKELAQYIQPRRGRFFISDRNKGDKRHQSIINSKATQAHGIARSGMLAGTMSPTRPWFALETQDPELMEFGPVKDWMFDVELILREIFNTSNYYNMAPVLLGELLLFGTGAMSHVNDFRDVARFFTHTAGSYYISQNERFLVDTFAREFEWTVSQIVGAFGLENVSTSVKTAWDQGNYDQWFPITHFVDVNPDHRPSSALSKFKPVRSVVYEPGNTGADKDKVLSEKGFDEFPVYTPRWDVTGEDIYGTNCPAMTALGDIKGLQIEEKRKAQAIDKMVNPPLSGPPSLKNVNVSSLPGGLNVYDGGEARQELRPLYTVNPALQELRADIAAVEDRIDKAFFVDMFLAISNIEGIQPRNQLDLMQRNEERLLQLGPVLERLQGEWLNQMIDRTFNQAMRAGILPTPPQELQGSPLKIRYISTLAMAQRAVATQSLERVAGFVGSMAELKPEVLDKFDADQAVDEYARAVGVPPRVIVPDDQVAQERAERQQQQELATALESAQSAANTAKLAGDTKTGEQNLLTELGS